MGLMNREEKRNHLIYYKSKEDLIELFLDLEERYDHLFEGFKKATEDLKKAQSRWVDYEKKIEKIYRYIISDEFDYMFEEDKSRKEVKQTIEDIIDS